MSDLQQLAALAQDAPQDVRTAYRNAHLLVDEVTVQQGLHRLAVRLTLQVQDLNPLWVTVLPDAAVLHGQLAGRMVFPCQQAFVRQTHLTADLDGLVTPRARAVVVLDGMLHSAAQRTVAAWAEAAGSQMVLQAAMVSMPVTQSVLAAVQLPASTQMQDLPGGEQAALPRMFGAGLSIMGYGANLGGLYVFDQ